MSNIDEYEAIASFRAVIPFPSQARLATGRARLLTAATGHGHASHQHRPAGHKFLWWRPAVALAAAAAIAAGAGYALTASARGPAQPAAVQTLQQATLAAKLLHTAAARVAREAAT